LDDPKRLARFLFEIGYAHIFSTNTAVGIPMLERARAIGEAAGDELITGYVSMGLLWGHVSWHEMDGEWRATIAGLAEEAERIGRKHDDNCLISKTLAALTIGYVVNGRPHLARRYAVQLFDLSRETSDPRPRAMGLWALATIELTHFAYEDCVESGRESARLALSVVDRSLAEAMLGAGYVMLGRTGDGTALLSNSIDLYLSKGLRSAVATLRPFLGIAKVMDGDMAGGIRWIEDGLEQCRDWGAASGIAIGHLVLGEIYTQIALGHDRPPLRVMLKNIGFLVRTLPRVQTIARRNLETALDTFRKWDTPSYIASALYNLARLDLNTGRADDAASKLAEARALAVDVEAETLLAMIDEAASG